MTYCSRIVVVQLTLFKPVKGKAVPLKAWSGPEVSRQVSFPDFVKTAQDGGRLSALSTGCIYPPGNTPSTHFC